MTFPRVVYVMTHDATGKSYVGSTANPTLRFRQHLNALKRGRHKVSDLQADYNAHDNKGMTFSIVDSANNWSEHFREYEWMDALGTGDRKRGYNYNDIHFTRLPGRLKKKHAE